MSRRDLSVPRLLAIWAPLAATFLLLTGATPIVNASINRLPGRDHEADLAAFAVFLACTIVIHSPLFVTREIAIKLAVDDAGTRRALRFGTAAGAVLSLFELLLGLTPLGAWTLGAFTDRAEVIAAAQPAYLAIWPVPILIGIRAVYQAHQIRKDDTLFVGLGTAFRLAFTAVFGLSVAPLLNISGPLLGAICITVGVGVETVFAMFRAKRAARPPATSDIETPSVLAFGLPLMFANFLGVAASLFYLRIAGLVPDDLQEDSLAAFQEVKSLHWLFASGAFALQSLTTAKVVSKHDIGPMLRFGAVVGALLGSLMAICAFTPLRRVILVDLMNEHPEGFVMRFAVPTLMLAVAMPVINSVRFTLRGILISQGRTRAITAGNVTTLVLISTAISFSVLPLEDNGALNAYVLWLGALAVEMTILSYAAFRTGRPRGSSPPPESVVLRT